MWSHIFLFVIAAARVRAATDFTNSQEKVFHKCCPLDRSLIKVNELSEQYKCVKSEFLEKNNNISSAPLYISRRVRIKHDFPSDCDEVQIVEISDTETEIQPQLNVCYDRLVAEMVNNTLYGIVNKVITMSCNDSQQAVVPDYKLNINQIRKCCPRGQTFDIKYHECRFNVDQSEKHWLKDQLDIDTGDILYDMEYGVSCKLDEYSVELSEDAFSLSIEGNNLLVSRKNENSISRLMSGEWCIDKQYGENKLVAQVCTRNCDKFSAYCMRKCCPMGQHYKLRRCGYSAGDCVPTEDINVMFNVSTYLNPLRAYNNGLLDVMGLRINLQCPHGKFALNTSKAQERFWLTEDAHLKTASLLTTDYCLEAMDRRECPSNDVIYVGLTCFIPPSTKKDFRISFIAITISCVCLGLTLFVYCALSELRNLHGQTLICHVSMMLLACSCLARAQHSHVSDIRVCTAVGYGIYFGFVAAFVWLNVMCFDIWWTFGSMRTVKPLRKSGSERRRFIWYSVYAWGITVVFTVTMLLFDIYPVSRILDANIGFGACWFASVDDTHWNWPHYIFFVIPMAIVTSINFVLWLLTARHCSQVKSEVHRLQAGSVGERAKRTFRIDKAKHIITAKLWIVMGAGWLSELLSTIVVEPKWLWDIVDLINALQGVFIFLILVAKPKVYRLIKKKLGSSPSPIDTRLDKPDVQKNATSSGRTSSTFLSRTISSDERAILRTSLPNNIKQP